MPVAHHGAARWARWTYLLGVFSIASLAGWSLLDGRPGDAAIAAVCVVAVVSRPVFGVFAAAGAALLGAWLTAGLALVTVLAVWSQALATRLPRRRLPPPDVLAEALSALPEDLLYTLRIRAAGKPLTTWHALSTARLADPALWDPLLGRDPGPQAWDGPVVELDGHPGEVTLFFAEAAGLCAQVSTKQKRDIDLDLIALAACTIPLSAAGEWVNDLEATVERVLGASMLDFFDCVSDFAGTATGSDLLRRLQVGSWAQRAALDDRQLIFDFELAKLPGLIRGLRS